MKFGASILIGRLFLISLTVIQSITGTCIFPKHLQRQTWLYKINRSHNSQNVINFVKGKMTVNEQVQIGITIKSQTYQCEEMMDIQKYLVTESVSGSANKYKCIELVQRSSSVYQLRMSVSSNEKDNLCTHTSLILDPWPMVSLSEMQKAFITCPFSGGYNMKIKDSKGNPHGCNSMDLPMRFESECIAGEGISFNFRKKDCLDFMPMEKYQKAFCFAHWKTTNYVFILLRKAEGDDVWILRIPRKVIGYEITIELFTDVVAVDEAINEKAEYFSISLEKIPQKSLCVDEYNRCSTMTCNSYFRDQCPKSCHKCDPKSPTPVCSFPKKFRGEWFIQDQYGLNEVNISESYFQWNSVGIFKCVSFSDSPSREESKYTTVSIFSNGCRPRYTCLDFHFLSGSVLGFALSQSFIWPLNVDNPGTRICEEGRFEPDPSPVSDTYRPYLNTVKPLLPVSKLIIPVPCDIQSSFSFRAKITGAGSCDGFLYKDCSNTSVLQILFEKCNNHASKLTYFCAANIQSNYWEKVILLQNAEDDFDGGCLAFTQLRPNEAILLPPGQCDTYSWTFTDSKARNPLIHFSISVESQRCRDIPTTVRSPVKDFMVDIQTQMSTHFEEGENIKGRTLSYAVTPGKDILHSNIPSSNNEDECEHFQGEAKVHCRKTNGKMNSIVSMNLYFFVFTFYIISLF